MPDRFLLEHITKVYLCIFVCPAIKAIHLKLIMDFTMEYFVNCLNRFLLRRYREIYLDNRINFLDARNELHRICEFFEKNQQLIYDFEIAESIDCMPHHYISGWLFLYRKAPLNQSRNNRGNAWRKCIHSRNYLQYYY